MGIASVIVGILGIILSMIPSLWWIVVIHIVIGLGLGVVGMQQKGGAGDNRAVNGTAIAGICLNVVAIVLVVAWRVFWHSNAG